MNRSIRKNDLVFMLFNNLILAVILIVTLYPMIYILSASFSSAGAVTSGRVWLWPVEIGLEGYAAVFKYKDIWIGFANTFIYTTAGTAISVVLTIMAAYPLSRPDFKARSLLMFLFTFTMFFSGGMIPSYLLVDKLNLVNTRWAMILPGAISIYNLIITRTFFQVNISKELLEAARLDGCNDLKFLLRIVVPLSGAILAVNALFYAVGQWNGFFSAILYLKDNNLMPLQIKMRAILVMNQVDPSMLTSGRANVEQMSARANLRELLKYSLIIVSSVPVMIMYPFIQKHFVKGVMIGAIKG